MKILDRKDAINRRLYGKLIIVETAIHRVSCLNRTVLNSLAYLRTFSHKSCVYPQNFTLQVLLSSTDIRQLVRASRDNS